MHLFFWSWCVEYEGLREFATKEGKFRNPFYFKVEVCKHYQLIPWRGFQAIYQLKITEILHFRMSSIHTNVHWVVFIKGVINRTIWWFFVGHLLLILLLELMNMVKKEEEREDKWDIPDSIYIISTCPWPRHKWTLEYWLWETVWIRPKNDIFLVGEFRWLLCLFRISKRC